MKRVLIFPLIAIVVMGISLFGSGVDRNYLRVTGYSYDSTKIAGNVSDTMAVISTTTMDNINNYRTMAVYGRMDLDTVGSTPLGGDTLVVYYKPFYGDSGIWLRGDVSLIVHDTTKIIFGDTLNVPVCDSIMLILAMNAGNNITDSISYRKLTWRLYNPED